MIMLNVKGHGPKYYHPDEIRIAETNSEGGGAFVTLQGGGRIKVLDSPRRVATLVHRARMQPIIIVSSDVKKLGDLAERLEAAMAPHFELEKDGDPALTV